MIIARLYLQNPEHGSNARCGKAGEETYKDYDDEHAGTRNEAGGLCSGFLPCHELAPVPHISINRYPPLAELTLVFFP